LSLLNRTKGCTFQEIEIQVNIKLLTNIIVQFNKSWCEKIVTNTQQIVDFLK